MTTYLLTLPARPRGQWFGWGTSLAVHAGVLAWLVVAAVPATPPAAPPEPRMRFVLVPPHPRPLPAVPAAVVPVPETVTQAPRPARVVRSRPAASAAPAAPARTEAAAVPAESTPVITSATPAASEPVAPAGGEAGTGSVDASANEAAPSFDMAEARSTARLIAKHRKDGLVAFPKPEPPLQRDDRLGRAIERARRADCKTAYAGLSLLAIIPLVKDTVTGTGCKW